MTQNPHMKKNIDLREREMLMNVTSKRPYFKIMTSTAESGSCGSPSPQESLISPNTPRTPCTHVARAPPEFDEH